MKKNKALLKSVSALLFATSLIFGAVSCSSDDSEDETPKEQKNEEEEKQTDEEKKSEEEEKKESDEKDEKESAGTITMNGTPYDSIQAALDAAASASGDCVITLTAATYKENGLKYSGSNNLKISGLGSAEYGKDVVILGQGADLSSEKGRSTFAIAGSGNIVLENLTIKSTRQNTEGTAQAEVIGTDGSGNLAAYNCSFLSGQDTMRTVAKAWFYKCYIEGDVDFTWMEYTNGVAALYEECVLHAIGTRTTKAYFTAPRLGITSKVGKGLVIYNSKLEAESGLKELYLGRNPWASSNLKDYYEQVAFIGTTYDSSNVALHADVWASAANGTADQKYIGFKTDENFPKGKYGVVLDKDFVAAEYAGRENILNRLFVVASSKFQKDTDTYWDVAKVASDNNWNVTEDSSKSLLDGEGEVKSVVYDFSVADAGAYTDSLVKIDGFSYHDSGAASGAATKTITIPLTGKAVVTVKGCYSGWGTVKAGSQGEGLYNINSGSTTKYLECSYVVYDTTATSVVITAATISYINSITVEYDDSLSYTAVSGITVASDTSTPTVGVAAKMTASVTPDTATNPSVKWTSSDETVGTIDEFSGEVKFIKTGKVTFTATARDGSGKSGSVTLAPETATWTSAEWYYTKNASASAVGSGIGADASNVAGENVSVFNFNAYSGIALGGTKNVSTSTGDKEVSMGLKMDGNGKFSFGVAKNATLKFKQAYIKVLNSDGSVNKDYSGYITVTSSDGTATLVSGATSAISADTDYEWTLTPGTYTVARYTGNTSPIVYVRVDITE